MCRLLTLGKICCYLCAGYSPWGRYSPTLGKICRLLTLGKIAVHVHVQAVHVQVTHPGEDMLLLITHPGEDRLLFLCKLLTLGKISYCSCAGYSPWGNKVAVYVPVTHPGEGMLLFMCRLLTLGKIGCCSCAGYTSLGR